jgi:hypothetical protein
MVSSLTASLHNKSASGIGALFSILLLAPLAANAQGTVSPLEIGGGISALRFDYREFDKGRIINRELGGIPGLSLRLGQRRNDWEWEAAGIYHYGRVNYTGEDNHGVPLSTTTNESIGDTALRFGYWLDNNDTFMPYAGLGYHYWGRDIHSIGTVSGLYEVYRWPYFWLGGKLLAYERNGSRVMLDFGLVRPLHTTLDVYVYSTHTRLAPVGKNGFRLSLISDIPLTTSLRMTLTPYAENWEFGRSPSTANGIYEPISSTRNGGLDLKLNWKL